MRQPRKYTPRAHARKPERPAAATAPCGLAMGTKTLRPYQSRDVQFVTGTNDAVCIEGPTGSGKTLTIVVTACILLRPAEIDLQGATGVVIATPMEHIEAGFTDRDYSVIAMPAGEGFARCVFQAPRGFVQAARDNGSSRANVGDYLRVVRDYALACTHSALLSVKLPKDLTGKVLIVDEAHRAPVEGNKFAKLVDQWQKRGGRVIFFTATAFRGDGTPVIRESMRVLRRSLAQHMTERDVDGFTYAPAELQTSVVPLIASGTTPRRYRGEEAPPATMVARTARAMVNMWIEDGRPCLMVRVPPTNGSDAFVREIIRAFVKEIGNADRVFDASGVGEKTKRALIDLLKRERDLSYNDRSVDVIIGIQRTLEGTDWAKCSAMYVWGLPGSPTAIVQLIGRTMRKKEVGHPFQNLSHARFFVPTYNQETCDLLQRTQARDTLGISCLLGDLESPAEWPLEKAMIEEIRAAAESEYHFLDMLAELGTAQNEDVRERMEKQFTLAAIVEREPGVTVGQAIDAANNLLGDPQRETSPTDPVPSELSPSEALLSGIKKIAAEQIFKTAKPDVQARALKIIKDTTKKSILEGFGLGETRRRVADALVEAFSAETMTLGPNVTAAAHHAYSLMGGTMQRYAYRIFGRTPLTDSLVHELGESFQTEYGRYPRANDGPMGLPDGEDWANIDHALRYGKRGLRGGSSLAKMFGYARPDHTIVQILQWADRCFKKTGRWPSSTEMREERPQDYGLPDPAKWGFAESWPAIDQALRDGLRGLPGGMTLYRLLIEHGRIKPSRSGRRS